ncbi:NUDIX domain protein [Dichotomopilus funicola]|uniref:NUDIX domain protein n=1 Tax=Dichotomopilus funicola TaxID=1934379 RepID=A0AAN6ZKN0_9PEZI|nr:NUDIX domain protein [Dichotomopilus funicola]
MSDQNPIERRVIGTRQGGVQYSERLAVRVVVLSPKGEVALVKANRDNYYKLPGGGIESGEDHGKAAEREVLEETGCHVLVKPGCFATTEEFRNDLHQISYCYRATLLDGHQPGNPELTEEEVSDGLKHEWVPVEKALQTMENVEPTSKLGRYIKERDLFLLTEFLKSIQ